MCNNTGDVTLIKLSSVYWDNRQVNITKQIFVYSETKELLTSLQTNLFKYNTFNNKHHSVMFFLQIGQCFLFQLVTI